MENVDAYHVVSFSSKKKTNKKVIAKKPLTNLYEINLTVVEEKFCKEIDDDHGRRRKCH